MRLLAAYRHQLSEEAAGRSDRFARILRYFRLLWLLSVAAAIAFVGYGFWVASTTKGDGTGSMALIIFPVGALLIILAGRIPYGLAQLFLSVKAERNG